MATATARSRACRVLQATVTSTRRTPSATGRVGWRGSSWLLRLVIIVVAGIPVVMSLRESLYQTNSGVDPTTGLVAGGELRRSAELHQHLRRAEPVTGSYGTMDRFWNAFLNTTFITIVCVLLETVLGVAMALIMAKAFQGRGVVRAGILVLGHPDDRLGADVEADLRRGRRDEPDPRTADPLAGPTWAVLLGDRHRRRLEDRTVHRAADPGRSADHSR